MVALPFLVDPPFTILFGAAVPVALLDYSRRQLERLFDRRRVASEP